MGLWLIENLQGDCEIVAGFILKYEWNFNVKTPVNFDCCTRGEDLLSL